MILNLVFLGFVKASKVSSVPESMQPGPSASAGTGSSSSSGMDACQKIHKTLQRALLFPTGVVTKVKRGADYPKASQEESRGQSAGVKLTSSLLPGPAVVLPGAGAGAGRQAADDTPSSAPAPHGSVSSSLKRACGCRGIHTVLERKQSRANGSS